jgi:hypothetical protein
LLGGLPYIHLPNHAKIAALELSLSIDETNYYAG